MLTLDPALVAELGLTVTAPGYLIEMAFSSMIRCSTFGDVTVDGDPFLAAPVKVIGLSRSVTSGRQPSLVFDNADLEWGALIGNQKPADKSIRVWSVWYGAPELLTLEFDGVGDSSSVSPDNKVTIMLAEDHRRYAYSPNKFIDAASGFTVLLPVNTQVKLGNQTFTLGRD